MSFQITILGSSGALPSYGRFPSSQYLQIQNRHFLVDCGEGIQMQMMKIGLNFHRISRIFISHLHGDHYLGLTGLLFTMHLQRRKSPLHLYSHPGLDEILTTQFRYSRSSPSFPIHFHPLHPGKIEQIYEDEVLTVTTIPLQHKISCSGFLFREKPKPKRINKNLIDENFKIQDLITLKKGEDVKDNQGNILYRNQDYTLPPKRPRSYAYCSDTAYSESLISQIEEINLLYHEATFLHEDEARAQDTFHSTARQAATIAKKARVDRLMIGHFSARYKDLSDIEKEAQSVFPSSFLALEGSTFTVKE